MSQRMQRVKINSTKFQPRNEYILVKPVELDKGEETTESGIVLSFSQNNSIVDRPTTGEVVEIGKDIEDIEKGMFVVWPETDGIDLEFDDGEFMLLRDTSIIGIKK